MQIQIIMRGAKMDDLEKEVREIQTLMECLFGIETDKWDEPDEDEISSLSPLGSFPLNKI